MLATASRSHTLLASPIEVGNTLIHPQTSLADYTTYRVGGLAEWYTAPRDRAGLYAAFDWFQGQDMPLTVLGAGSNLLVSDQGISGLVVSTRYLRQSSFNEATGQITVAA
jgi:UDP-N-acetylmuramate dehydrogenase